MRRASLPSSAVVAALAVAVLAAGCIPERPSPSPEPAPSASPAPTPAPTADPEPAGEVRVDPTLLDLLPQAVDGVALTADPATAADIAADGSLATLVDAVAVATAFGPIATDETVDYVVVTLARLRPDAFDELVYRVWRDTFDGAVCEQAGGIEGNAEGTLGGRTAYIGTCVGGVRTYHIHLPGPGVIVSMQAAGDERFGEQVAAGLTE